MTPSLSQPASNTSSAAPGPAGASTFRPTYKPGFTVAVGADGSHVVLDHSGNFFAKTYSSVDAGEIARRFNEPALDRQGSEAAAAAPAPFNDNEWAVAYHGIHGGKLKAFMWYIPAECREEDWNSPYDAMLGVFVVNGQGNAVTATGVKDIDSLKRETDAHAQKSGLHPMGRLIAYEKSPGSLTTAWPNQVTKEGVAAARKFIEAQVANAPLSAPREGERQTCLPPCPTPKPHLRERSAGPDMS